MAIDNDTAADRDLLWETVAQITELINDRMAIRVDSPDTDLLQSGALDASGLVQLMSALGERFGLDPAKLALELESFRSIHKIAALVLRLQPDTGAAPERPFAGLIGEVQSVLLEQLSVRVDSQEADLFRTGVLDSMALVRFIMALEDRFNVQIPIDEVDVAAFRSVADIAILLVDYMNRRGSATAGGGVQGSL